MKARFTFILFFISLYLHAQQAEGLSISLERDGTQLITYPPQTEFYLFNHNGNVILADGDLTSDFPIREEQFLIVKPPYKDDYDRFTLRQGDTLGLPGNRSEKRWEKRTEDYGAYKGPVTLVKEFLGSSDKGERNVLLVFSNGLVFRYFNGVARAWYEGEEMEIQGKYIIDIGPETVKFSYDPSTGKVWYVIEANH